MTETTDRIQDHPLDESTGGSPQHFDADGYVLGRPHHEAVANEDLTPAGTLVREAPGAAAVAARPEASIAPPPGDPNAPVPGPEGVPPGPDVTPAEPGPPTPDEPNPFLPDEPGQSGEAPRTVGGEAF